MLPALPSEAKLIAAGAVAVVFGVMLFSVYRWGGASCRGDQAMAQIEQNEKEKKSDENIDHKTPFDGSRDVAINWLLNHTRKQ